MGQFCGVTGNKEPIRSRNHTIAVHFKTDDTRNSTGFILTYQTGEILKLSIVFIPISSQVFFCVHCQFSPKYLPNYLFETSPYLSPCIPQNLAIFHPKFQVRFRKVNNALLSCCFFDHGLKKLKLPLDSSAVTAQSQAVKFAVRLRVLMGLKTEGIALRWFNITIMGKLTS